MSDTHEVYTGDDPHSFESNIGKLKDAFVNLLPEILQKGRHGEFTSLKESFPCIRAANQTNPNILAQAKIQDEETLNRLSTAHEAYEFLHACFQDNLIHKDHANRDQGDAFMTYDLLHSQILIIRQALKTTESSKECNAAIGNVTAAEFSSKVQYNLSKFRSTKELIYQENVELAYQRFEEAKDTYFGALNAFSVESRNLATIRSKPYDTNYPKHAFLNDILWKNSKKLSYPANEPCSIDEYFAKQEFMWSDALQCLTKISDPPQRPHTAVGMSPARPSQTRVEEEKRKFTANRVAFGRFLEETSQEMGKMDLEELKLSLSELKSEHKALQDKSKDLVLQLDDSETAVFAQSRTLMRTLAVKIGSNSRDEKNSEEKRKQEVSANLKALGSVTLPNLTGFSDYLAWKEGQEKLNTHIDGFKKAAVLLNTLKNENDKARCQGIYDYDELMSILKTKYSHQEKLVPALINKLRKLPEPQTDEVMQRNIDVILNVYSQLKSISNVAISRFDSTVVEDMILKLTPRYQERYEDFIEDNKSNKSVLRFEEDGSVLETVISGASREEDRAPVDNSDTSNVKRSMFLTFLKRTETKLANMAARKVNLSTSSGSGGSKFQKCAKCKTKPCKCKKTPRSAAYAVQVTNDEKVCPVCPTIKPHLNKNRKPTKCLSACKAFREKPVNERRAIVKRTKACHVCLNQGHFAKDCTRTYKCNKCQGLHNILLCDKSQGNPSQPIPSAPPMEEIDADSNFVKSSHG